MGGSLMQLVAVGAQDVPLIGNPQMTYFKNVFKRYTNFSLESIPLPFNQQVDFGRKVTCLIDRKGDLVSDMVLEIKLPALPEGISWINGIGHHLIQKVELYIGGEIVDTIYGGFLDIHSELTLPESKRSGYYQMVGKYHHFTRYSQDNETKTLYIPLPFWFCKNYGQSLPLIALQYHDVKIDVYLNSFSKMWYSGTSMSNKPSEVSITNAQVYCDYIFLDTKERRYFAMNPHSYLIEQHQINSQNPVLYQSPLSKAELSLNLPVKELYWVYQANSASTTNDWSNYSYTMDNDQNPSKAKEPINTVGLRINGYERFEPREGSYFRLFQPFKHHTSITNKYIYSYSFSLHPEKGQPSGAIDFSWINSAFMEFSHLTDILQGNITIYAINYNYLQITNGMASLIYQS